MARAGWRFRTDGFLLLQVHYGPLVSTRKRPRGKIVIGNFIGGESVICRAKVFGPCIDITIVLDGLSTLRKLTVTRNFVPISSLANLALPMV